MNLWRVIFTNLRRQFLRTLAGVGGMAVSVATMLSVMGPPPHHAQSQMAWTIGGCAFLIGILSITQTMMPSVFGRIRELAIARVCGFSRKQIASMILGESLMVAALGTLSGWMLNAAAPSFLGSILQLQGGIAPAVGWVEIMAVAGLASFTALAGALYPAWHAARLDPCRALRH